MLTAVIPPIQLAGELLKYLNSITAKTIGRDNNAIYSNISPSFSNPLEFKPRLVNIFKYEKWINAARMTVNITAITV